jgi:glucose-6-phosphate 1-dehydrogenase
MEINTWRWQGVPFYLRTGKRMPRKLTQVAVVFRKAPIALFKSFGSAPPHSNILVINVQPHEGFSICFDVKMPGKPFRLDTRALNFDYQEAFGPIADAYQTLLLDLLAGDQTLFVRGDVAEASWRLYDPLLKGDVPIHPYSAFTWGPKESDELLARQGHQWQISW